MDEQLLVKLALGCILLGLPLLWMMSYSVEEREGVIGDNLVRFSGEIVKVDAREEVVFLTIIPSTGFKVIIFDEVGFIEGDEVIVEGSLDWYKGEMEIIGEELRAS